MSSLIGIFDSGLGGFTVYTKIIERHPYANCLYLGDTARVPYGEKNSLEIKTIASEIIHWLRDQGVSAIVVACNTTNSLAFDVLQKEAGVPVFGLIEASLATIHETRLGILATPATTTSKAYRRRIQEFRPGTFVVEQACPRLVPLIEAGDFYSDELREHAIRYLSPVLECDVEAVVLGCSHYPLINSLLREIIPQHVRLIDPAFALARQLDSLLGSPKNEVDKTSILKRTRICVTSDSSDFADRAKNCLGIRPDVELVSLQPSASLF